MFLVALREMRRLKSNPIYGFCMVIFPVLVTIFFTSMMDRGVPGDMPVGIVDCDQTSTSRALVRQIDAFQTSRVVARYPSVAEARRAAQRGEVYAFFYIPEGTTAELLSQRQPTVSFYYNLSGIASGSLLMKDLRTAATLGSAAVGKATMQAHGLTAKQIEAALQPIKIDLHQIANPWTNYNVYLSTMLIPGVLMLFMFLITAYSLGTELKFGTSKELIALAGGRTFVALTGKLLPQTLIFLAITFAYEGYVFGHLGFPHEGGTGMLILLAVLQVLSAQGFGVFAFGLMPSLRMSMSICSLWAVLSFSLAGAAFPVEAMDAPIQSLSWLFPLRHYFMIYQTCVFNGFPLLDAWLHVAALLAFALLPMALWPKIKHVMLTYVYVP